MAAIGRMLTGFLGSVAIFFGIVMFFFALTGHAIVNNVDKLDDVAIESMKEYVKENREEVRGYIKSQYDASEVPSKEQLVAACINYRQLPEGAKAILTAELCSGIGMKSQEQIENEVIDSYVDTNLQKISEVGLPVAGAEDVKEAILQWKGSFKFVKALVISSIFVYFIGILLTFVGANFKLWRGLYRVLFKTTINVAAFTFIFGYLKFLKPENLIDAMHKFASLNPDYSALAEVPPVFIKLIAKVILDWISYSTSYLFNLSLYILIPFAIATLGLGIWRYVMRKKGKPMPGEKIEVPEKKDVKKVHEKKDADKKVPEKKVEKPVKKKVPSPKK